LFVLYINDVNREVAEAVGGKVAEAVGGWAEVPNDHTGEGGSKTIWWRG
jgi:hypothetical protein